MSARNSLHESPFSFQYIVEIRMFIIHFSLYDVIPSQTDHADSRLPDFTCFSHPIFIVFFPSHFFIKENISPCYDVVILVSL